MNTIRLMWESLPDPCSDWCCRLDLISINGFVCGEKCQWCSILSLPPDTENKVSTITTSTTKDSTNQSSWLNQANKCNEINVSSLNIAIKHKFVLITQTTIASYLIICTLTCSWKQPSLISFAIKQNCQLIIDTNRFEVLLMASNTIDGVDACMMH